MENALEKNSHLLSHSLKQLHPCHDLIQEFLDKELKDDIDSNKTELIMKLMIIAAIYEFMFMHKTPVKVVIAEYLKVSDFFVKSSQKSFLNAILDKVAKVSRVTKN